MAGRRYVDVNVFVYWLGKHPSFGERAKAWIEKIEKGGYGDYVTSSLTVYETAVVLASIAGMDIGDAGFVGEVFSAISLLPGLAILSLEAEDFELALKCMKDFGLDFEDAIHAAAAIRAGAEEIVSNDGDFDRSPLKRLF